MGKATNSIARKGSRGNFPLAGCRGGAPAGVWGNAPTVPRATSMPNALNKGRRQRSVPASNSARPQTRPQAALSINSTLSRRWARPTSMGEGFLSLLVFFVAGISPLRRRQGGFPIAPLTPSAPPRWGLSATRFVRSKRFPCQSAFLPDYKTPAAAGQLSAFAAGALLCCLENTITPARTASCTARRRSRPFAAAPRACRIR